MKALMEEPSGIKKLSFFLQNIEGKVDPNKTLESRGKLGLETTFFSRRPNVKNVPYDVRIKILLNEDEYMKFEMPII